MSNRAAKRRIDKFTAKELQYAKSGYGMTATGFKEGLANIVSKPWPMGMMGKPGRSKYMPHTGKKRGGPGPVYADWYKKHEEYAYNPGGEGKVLSVVS